MTETLNNTENKKIKSLVEQMEKLDLEFDKKSSQLTRKIADIEEKIENLEKDDAVNEKYSSLILELKQMLEDLRVDGNIDNMYTNNKIIEKLNNISGTDLFTKNRELFFNIFNNFNNANIITPEIKELFKKKFAEYAKTGGYEFKEGAEIQTGINYIDGAGVKKYFEIKKEDLTKVPENFDWSLETGLAGYFGD